jgi:hypothetical protein
MNPGDWAYQGFAEMNDSVGFDMAAYETHYGLSDADQKITAYGIAMDQLVERLRRNRVFEDLKMSPDFYVCRVEHNY